MVAEDLVDTLAAKLESNFQRLASFPGSTLDSCQYRHPFAGRVSPVVIGGDYITAESGTGLVHTAPGHGQEDYQVQSPTPYSRNTPAVYICGSQASLLACCSCTVGCFRHDRTTNR